MAVEQRIQSLRKRHSEIDHLIRVEEAHSSTDPATLHELKRQKLLIKDELEFLTHDRKEAA